ncbi:hypothetical protein EDC14_105815 [Hydrogenispora ethanolica]|uniref:Uncharacterized protein n=1 Tax=Hydrogenispora ethanolica TaxID=1082276 RepID=A0A4V2QB43_HYDET|nr:hypothetical protein EDC14_105815 [Hydrogenispora ethanolica]
MYAAGELAFTLLTQFNVRLRLLFPVWVLKP